MSLVKKFIVLGFLVLSVSCSVPRPDNPPQSKFSNPSILGPVVPPLPSQSRNQYYPFDLIVDTVAFMDCPALLSAQNPNFFAFKFASYFEGIRLSKDFLRNVEPYTPQQVNTEIRSSAYLNTKAQISLSAIGDPPQALGAAGGGRPKHGFFLPLFSHPTFIDQIVKDRESRTIVSNRPLETIFPVTGNNLPSLSSYFGRSHVFTLTYSTSSNNNPLSLKPSVYYGRTYDVILDGGEHGKSYLSDIEESNLITNKKQGRWDCPEKLRLRIHRHKSVTQHTYNKYTRYFTENGLSQEGECIVSNKIPKRKDRQLLETILSLNSFNIGETHIYKGNDLKGTGEACVALKDARQSCYANSGAVRIEFDSKKSCNFLDSDNRCPSYLSVCLRR